MSDQKSMTKIGKGAVTRTPQHEIRSRGPLLRHDGRLLERGWSRRPLRTYDPSRAGRVRLKEWDYIGVYSGRQFLTVMIAHLGYLAIGACQWLDLDRKRKVAERIAATPLGLGCSLSTSSETGHSSLRALGRSIEFTHAKDGRKIRGRWPGLEVSLDVEPLPKAHDSIVMCTPIGDRGFYYNHKISGLRASGFVQAGPDRLDLAPDSLGTLDWGRGVWERKTFWNWATACGALKDGTELRLNLGCGFGDLSAATENCFFVNGRIVKLGGVTFRYDKDRLHQPWTFRSEDSTLALSLDPVYVNTKRTNLGLASSTLFQVFGPYSGSLRLRGRTIRVRDIWGWAEEHRARW